MAERRFQLVPYVAPGAQSQTVPTCRRPDATAAANSLASYLQSGGRLRTTPLGRTFQTTASSHTVEIEDDESVPLMSDRKIAAALMQTANRQSRLTLCAVVVALAVAISVFAGIGVVVWRVNSNMEAMEVAIAPHAREVINATVDMMHDMGGSFHNMHEISEYTNELAHATAGATGPAASAVNSTAVIAQKLAEFMQHPTIQLSLGGLGGGGR